MYYLNEYVKENNDSFDSRKFGTVDAMLLAHIAYFDYTILNLDFTKNESISFAKINPNLADNLTNYTLDKNIDKQIFKSLINSGRYKNLEIIDYLFTKENLAANFFAYTVMINKKEIAVIYRGTDKSFDSWIESFSMVYNPILDGQIVAKKYLEHISKKFNQNIYVMGHSKGGNFATYASSMVNSNIQKRIIKIYDFDGPGFLEDFYKDKNYHDISQKITKYVPEKSIVGNMLESKWNKKIIKSRGIMAVQHQIINWAISKNEPVFIDSSDFISESTVKSLNIWLSKYNDEEKKELLKIISDILNNLENENFDYIIHNKLASLQTITESIKNMDKEKQKLLLDAFTNFLSISTKEFFINLNNKI